jgi:hypothetical protein
MSEDEELDQQQPQPRRSGWKKFLLRFAIVIGIVVAIWLVVNMQISRVGQQRLSIALDRIKAGDPSWVVEDIEATRFAHAPSPTQNSAVVVNTVAEQIPAEWDKWRQQTKWNWNELSNHRASPEIVTDLRVHADSTTAARKIALGLRELPVGYRAFPVVDNPITLTLPHLDTTSRVVNLLQHDAAVATLDHQPDRGIQAAHAALNASRSIGDEPCLVSQLVRMRCRGQAAQLALQTLASGTPTTGLAELQAALLEDAEQPLFLHGIRGERAMLHRTFVGLQAGKINPQELFGPSGPNDLPGITRTGLFRVYKPLLLGDHAECMRLMTAYVDAAKRAWHEQRDAAHEVLAGGTLKDIEHSFTRLLLPACDKIVDAGLRSRAKLLTTAVALACERFRQQTGRWPRTLEEIPKSILPALPVSPFDATPLRYQLLPDGIVVSCFCQDDRLNIDGPEEFREPGMKGFGEGARLWNPAERGLPPKEDEDPHP